MLTSLPGVQTLDPQGVDTPRPPDTEDDLQLDREAGLKVHHFATLDDLSQ